jgi:hypothetical protein
MQRAAIMRKYVIPALEAQTFRTFEVWGLFMAGYEVLAKPVLRLFRECGFNVTFNGPAAIRKIYRERADTDWLGIIHNDSDDLYARGAFALFSKQRPAEGRVVYCPCGYAYDVSDRRKPVAVIGRPGSAPPSFYMAFYPRRALRSEPHWYGYRRRNKFEVRHFGMNKVRDPVRVSERCYCILLHGGNTVSQWKTLNSRKVGVVPANERASVLARFGVKE